MGNDLETTGQLYSALLFIGSNSSLRTKICNIFHIQPVKQKRLFSSGQTPSLRGICCSSTFFRGIPSPALNRDIFPQSRLSGLYVAVRSYVPVAKHHIPYRYAWRAPYH